MNNPAVQPKSASTPAMTSTVDYRAFCRLSGKRVLITGGDTSLSQAIAVHFAREGAHVALVCTGTAPASIRQAIQATGRICLAISGDIRELDTCDRALDEAVEAFDGLDILINNAGSDDKGTGGAVPALAFAALYLSRNALRVMESGGCILNVASDETVPAFTRSLAPVAARRGIRVNAVAHPGEVSDITIAANFAYLATDGAAGINGQVIDASEPAWVNCA